MTSTSTANVGDCNTLEGSVSLAHACSGSWFIVFMSLIDAWANNVKKISATCERIRPVAIPDEEYDFVVVGGGAAGSVVAARLSEVSDWKILLLEAGPDEPAGTAIPSFTFKFLETDITWKYKTSNESNACLSTGGSCSWPSGKNLGGNTAHNAMIYLRGLPQDYDAWAAQGNEDWEWETVEKYYIKGEDNGEIERVGREHHGTGGPLSVERFPYQPPMTEAIMKAAVELGFGTSEDLNGDVKSGFSVVQTTTKNGVRHSSAAAYLRPIRDRENLHISLNSMVTKVLIENGMAVGVEYHKDGEFKNAYVTREVIVSGGAMKSPQILMLSGIGPKEHLDSMGIEVVKDLPGMGENFHDHATVPLYGSIDEADTYDNNWKVAAEYLVNQTGPMASNGLIQSLVYASTSFTTADNPDIELYFIGYSANCAPGGLDELSSKGRRSLILLPSILRPKSKGRITLASNNPFDLPHIWGNYFGEQEDLDIMIEGAKMLLDLTGSEAMSSYNFTLSHEPACADYEFMSDEYLGCAIKQQLFCVYHQAGTCKMGPSSDSMAVVDPRLRVHGISGLRVADNSIMPEVVSANTQAVAMMIGERVADFIKEDWGIDTSS